MTFTGLRGIIRASLACACVCGAFAAAGAAATTVTYTFSGTASGTLGSTPFTNAPFTATGQGDSSAVVFTGVAWCNDLGPITIAIGGVGTVTTTATNLVFSNQTTDIWGFENGTCTTGSGDWLDVLNPLAGTYELEGPIGPSSGTQDVGGEVVVTGGQTLTLSSVPLTFTASTFVTEPVPALGSGSMAVLGLMLAAMATFALRRVRV